ncbi:hypothetical protein ISS86_01270 [Candidatus Microgenomates bacterium]|nr:hypothetical protein [Candidatus Microgenomates bacterium]
MNTKRVKHYSQKGFLENLKDLGGGIIRSAVEDVVKGTAEELAGQITGLKTKKVVEKGTLEQGQPLDLAAREKEIREQERQSFERQKAHEKIAWTKEQQEVKFQIEALQQELKKLVNETEGLSREIKTAAVQAIVEPGTYHLNFFERLQKMIKLIRKKVQESKTWLVEWNSYSKRKRNVYWTQVKKSGTKYMLSSERYMSTQAG